MSIATALTGLKVEGRTTTSILGDWFTRRINPSQERRQYKQREVKHGSERCSRRAVKSECVADDDAMVVALELHIRVHNNSPGARKLENHRSMTPCVPDFRG